MHAFLAASPLPSGDPKYTAFLTKVGSSRGEVTWGLGASLLHCTLPTHQPTNPTRSTPPTSNHSAASSPLAQAMSTGVCITDPAIGGTFDLDLCPSLLAMLEAINGGATDFPVVCEPACAKSFYTVRGRCWCFGGWEWGWGGGRGRRRHRLACHLGTPFDTVRVPFPKGCWLLGIDWRRWPAVAGRPESNRGPEGFWRLRPFAPLPSSLPLPLLPEQLSEDCLTALTEEFAIDTQPIGVLGSRFLDDCAEVHAGGAAPSPAPAPLSGSLDD